MIAARTVGSFDPRASASAALANCDVLAAPVARLLGGSEALPGPFVTEEEMRMLVNVGEEEGVIQHEEEEMIHSIFEFGDTVVREVMVPRPFIVAVEDDCDAARAGVTANPSAPDAMTAKMRFMVPSSRARIAFHP